MLHRRGYKAWRLTRNLKSFGLWLVASFVAAVPAAALPNTLPPVDQCRSDASFVKFHGGLKQAIEGQDLTALLAMLAPDVLLDFGGGRGRDEFLKQWAFSDSGPKDLPLESWTLLQTLMRLGCARSGSSRIIPSTFVQFEGEPAENTYIVASPAAELRVINESDAEVVATLAWDVVTIVGSGGDWQSRVRLADGREGYLFDEDLYSPLGHRFTIEKREGKWMITSLVSGD